jgi:predicted DNA-binding protein (MmcQ/YjbR family)
MSNNPEPSRVLSKKYWTIKIVLSKDTETEKILSVLQNSSEFLSQNRKL